MQGIPPDADMLTVYDIMQRRVERRRARSRGHQQNAMEARLQKLSTRELLTKFDEHRLYCSDDGSDPLEDIEWWALKKVLATREHVRGKSEGHRHRQMIAVRQHGQGKNQNR